MYSVLNTLSGYRYFYISKNITSYTFLLVFKIVENLQCILKTKMPLTVLNCYTILTENVCRLLCKSMLPTMPIKLCKVEADSSDIICGSRETYLKGKCSLVINIHHE